MICKRCQQKTKIQQNLSSVCAFTKIIIDYKISPLEYAEEQDKIVTTVFEPNNWNCATMNALREVIEEEFKKK